MSACLGCPQEQALAQVFGTVAGGYSTGRDRSVLNTAVLWCWNIWQAVSLAAYFSGENKSHRGVIRVTLCWGAGTQVHHRTPSCCHLVNRAYVRCSWMLSIQGGSGVLSRDVLANSQWWSVTPTDMLIKGIWGPGVERKVFPLVLWAQLWASLFTSDPSVLKCCHQHH